MKHLMIVRRAATLLLAATLLAACTAVASAEIKSQVVAVPDRYSEQWRITTFSEEMPDDITKTLSEGGFSDYRCCSGAMIQQMANQNDRDAGNGLPAWALVAMEKEDERILVGMAWKEKGWGLINLGTKALLPEREFTIGASESGYDSAWYMPLRFTITYPLADGGSETYGLLARFEQSGEAPLWNIRHHLWIVNDYARIDANGRGVAILNGGGSFRVFALPYDKYESANDYPAYLPFTLEHMRSITDFPSSDAEAKRLAEASWAPFDGTNLAIAYGVNLREFPTTSSKSLGKLRSGVLVHVLDEEKGTDAPWYHVRFGQEEGFVSGVYVKFPHTDDFAIGLPVVPLTVAKALDACTLRKTPADNSAGSEFPANTLMHVLADVDDGWLCVMVPRGDIGWEMDVDGTSGYVRANEVVQGN